jgi:transcriptional regulator with XRE-family HTH domain
LVSHASLGDGAGLAGFSMNLLVNPKPEQLDVDLPHQPVDEHFDLVAIVGGNLRRLRTRRGLSLERLSKLCGVSRAMLSQIELGHSAPTINVLWKIASALELPFAAFLEQAPFSVGVVLKKSKGKVLLSQDGRFSSRALFPFDGQRRVEFYELLLNAHSASESEAHPPGTIENIVVTRGQLEVVAQDRTYHLDQGDSVIFEADVPHTYRNPGPEAGQYYLVVRYAEDVG